jgi:hypothetical protein
MYVYEQFNREKTTPLPTEIPSTNTLMIRGSIIVAATKDDQIKMNAQAAVSSSPNQKAHKKEANIQNHSYRKRLSITLSEK